MPSQDQDEPTLLLLQHASAWGAPSLAVECTQAHALLKIATATYAALNANDAQAPWAHQLPLLRIGARTVEHSDIGAELKAAGYDTDAHLDATQRAESLAYAALAEERLGIALLHAQWADDDNFAAVTKPAYSARLPFPLSYYLPWTMRRRALSQLARRGYRDAARAHAAGAEALAAISTRLAERPYFHGERPSSVDASLFAHLSAALRCPVPNDELRRSLRALPNLERYCERFSRRHFGGSDELLPAVAAPERVTAQLERFGLDRWRPRRRRLGARRAAAEAATLQAARARRAACGGGFGAGVCSGDRVARHGSGGRGL